MASTYLSRTCGSTASSYTVSMWVRTARTSGTSTSALWWNAATNKLNWELNDKGQIYIYTPETRTTGYYRDVGAWYHLVWSVSSNVGTLYVNGVADSGLTSVSSIASLNSTNDIQIGGDNGGSTFDGSMAHVHFIDGTAYAASDFGETDATTGIWKPITAPSVTYGTNGFFLKFENSGSMGTDSSGNGNNLTVNGTCTQNIDTPSNVFATLNPLHFGTTVPTGYASLSNGNNTFVSTQAGSPYPYYFSTLAISTGKYYAEFKRVQGTAMIGVGSTSDSFFGNNSTDAGYYTPTGDITQGGAGSGYGDVFNDNDILGVALDLDNNAVYFSRNGTWQNSGDPTSGASKTGAFSLTDPSSLPSGVYHFVVGDSGGSTATVQSNFGNGYFGTTAVSSAQNPDDGIGIFEYDVPTGYRALCTKSINAEEYS